jgi:hypothetical protein
MAEMVVPNQGAKGIDISNGKGGKASLNADAKGRVTVEDPKLQAALKREGFTIAGVSASFINTPGHQCTGCAFKSVFKLFTCPKCETKNDYRD